MKTIHSLFLLPLFFLAFPTSALSDEDYDVTCGNDSQNDPPPDCPCESGDVGTNPINATKANHHREVPDIQTFGAAPIVFSRNVNSRTSDFNDPYWELGYKQIWQHNWNYEVRQLTTKTFGFFDIKVRYPNGNDSNFKAVDTTGDQLVPTAENGDRLYRWTGALVGYTLVTAGGVEYDFWRYLSPKFHLTQMRNGFGDFWDCTYDANEQLTRVTNNFGRWIQIDHETGTDGVLRISQVSTSDGRVVTYGYTEWAASGKFVLSTIDYPGGEQAVYTYVTADPTDLAARPLLASAFDPMYGAGKPGAQMKYVYNYNSIFDFGNGPFLITGTLLEERNSVTDQVTISFPLGSGSYPKIQEGDGTLLIRKYENGLIKTIGDGEGRLTTLARGSGGFGFVESETDARGAITQFTRDYAGRILSRTNALGHSRSSIYSEKGFVLSETDERGNPTVTTRDTVNARPVRKDYADGSYEEWTYDANSQALTHRLRNGGQESFSYDALGNMLTRTDALGRTTQYDYYPSGLVMSMTDARQFTTSYTYNWRGQMLTMTNPDETFRAYEYDVFGNRVASIDELGHRTDSTYDEYSRLQTVTDPLNRTTTYEYGLAPGCSTCSYVGTVSRVISPGGLIVEYEYDRSRLRTSQTVGAGTPDAATTQYGYDAGKNLTTTTDPRGKIWQSEFDDAHRRTSSTDPLGNQTRWAYDEAGNKTGEARPDGGVTNFTYDERNRLTQAVDPLSQATQMTYDSSDNLLTLTEPRGNIYAYGYDLLNRRTSLTYPGGSSESFGYDEVGNLTTYTTRAGQVRTSSYDNRKRETGFTWSDSTPAVTKTYDAAGRLLTLVNTASSLSFGYDDADQLTSETQQITGGGSAKTISYSYTADGKRQTLDYPGGTSVTYSYTARNQLNSLDAGAVAAGYSYDLNGNRLSKTLGNGTSASYVYDDANRLLSLAHLKGANNLISLDYAYNNVNNRTSRTETIAGVAKLDAYGYDATDQVTEVKYNYNAGNNTQDRLVGYAYDPAGNRQSVTDNGVGTSYTANELNQYTAVGNLAPSHDANGNLNGQGVWTYSYDAQNRLITAQKNGTNATFFYDGRNRCVKRTINSTTTYLYYDDWSLVEERSASDGLLAIYVNGANIDEIIARTLPAGMVYHHQDVLGSTVALSGATGNVLERYSYDVYGAPTIKAPNGQVRSGSNYGNRFFFTGREYILQVMLYDYRYRMYAPSFGRFLQTDPIRFDAGDENFYRYVGSAPVNARDPYGLIECPAGEREQPAWVGLGYSSWFECFQTESRELDQSKPPPVPPSGNPILDALATAYDDEYGNEYLSAISESIARFQADSKCSEKTCVERCPPNSTECACKPH